MRNHVTKEKHFVLISNEINDRHVQVESRNRPGVAQWVPGGLGSQIS